MKTITFLRMVIVLAVLLLINTACEKETITTEADLTEETTAFISSTFPNTTITMVISEEELFSPTIEVFLSDGTTLEFNKKSECIKIEGNGEKIPDSAIHPKIIEYVKANHAALLITKWEMKYTGYIIELSNNVELIFNTDGNFKRIDN